MRGLTLVGLALAVSLLAPAPILAAVWPAGLSFHSTLPGSHGPEPAGYEVLDDGSGEPLFVDLRPVISGDAVKCLGKGRDHLGADTLDGVFGDLAAERFSAYTREHIGDRFAVLFDGRFISAPVIQTQIYGPEFQISFGAKLPDDVRRWLADSGFRPCKRPTAAERAASNALLRDRLVRELGDPDSSAFDSLVGMADAGLIPRPSEAQIMSWNRTAVEAGNASAMAYLAMAYEFSFGVDPSSERALEWRLRAAEAGDPYSHLMIGWMYADGQGAPANQAKADEWFGRLEPAFHDLSMMHALASGGDSDSMFRLGVLFAYSNVVPRDQVQAIKWFRAAAAKNHAMSMHALGRLLLPSDRRQAVKWFKRAAKQRYWPAEQALRDLGET